MEMARGALGTSVDQPTAEAFVRLLGKLSDDQTELRKLCRNGVRLDVQSDWMMRTSGNTDITIRVVVDRGNPLVLTEPQNDFPSDHLKAKIMLVAG
jgi:hypothetical protein